MVYGGGGMNEEILEHHQDIKEAQEYLTVRKDGEIQLIVGIDYLSENHSRQEIIRFLKDYLQEKEMLFKELISGDRSNDQIDQTIGVMYRVQMAISIIEERLEVNNIVRIKQRTEESGQFHNRNRRRHSRSRQWQDKNHDGADREARHRTRRAA
jgi:hypothetical protein